MLTEKTYCENFTKAVRLIMAEAALDSVKDVSGHIGISYMTLYKIMNGNNKPTVDQIILVCLKGGFSPTWMLLNKGEKKIANALTMQKMANDLAVIKQEVLKWE